MKKKKYRKDGRLVSKTETTNHNNTVTKGTTITHTSHALNSNTKTVEKCYDVWKKLMSHDAPALHAQRIMKQMETNETEQYYNHTTRMVKVPLTGTFMIEMNTYHFMPSA